MKLKPPENTKELYLLPGAIQYMAKLPKHSERTDRLQKLLTKNETWNWAIEQKEYFGKLKQMLTKSPCIAHFAKDKGNIVTTDAICDASTIGLGITLWQKQDNGNTKSTAYRSRCLTKT